MAHSDACSHAGGTASLRLAALRHLFDGLWIEANLADWRRRWLAVFIKLVPLAVGIPGQIKAVLIAEGKLIEAKDRKGIGVSLHTWKTQTAYLRAVARGDVQRNPDGSEASFSSEDSRSHAQKLFDEPAVSHVEKERQSREHLSVNQKELSGPPAFDSLAGNGHPESTG